MSLIYIHGVKVRSPSHGLELEKPFRRWLTGHLGTTAAAAEYLPVYWGDIAAQFRWNLASRPKTLLLQQGGTAGSFDGLGSLRGASARTPFDRQVESAVNAGPVIGATPQAARSVAPPLSSIAPEARPDFLADLYLAVRPRAGSAASSAGDRGDPVVDDPTVAALAVAAKAVSGEWDRIVASEIDDDSRAARFVQKVDAALVSDQLLTQGAMQDWMTRAGETLKRAAIWPADAVATVFAELRPVANEFIAYFIGDVLAYLHRRTNATDEMGEIPKRVIAALKRAHRRKQQTGERIVVLTHSMGGQLLYDALTFFAPQDPELSSLTVDHWISFGAQVSFFAELGLFKGQPTTVSPQKLQGPACVTAWTNFFDRNDVVGFIMKPIFDGVEDIEYDTGYGLAFAHTGFLARPSFFENVAKRIKPQ